MEHNEIFKMMGFEDSENIARNYNGSSPVKDNDSAKVQVSSTEHSREEVQIGDNRYSEMTFAGPRLISYPREKEAQLLCFLCLCINYYIY